MLLVICMLITFMMPAMASSSATADKGLEKAIKAAKERIDIPADLTKFNYNIYSQDNTQRWYLSWSNDEAQKYLNVTIDGNNFISNYSFYHYSSNYDKKIPKYSKEQGRQIAEKFINKLDPKLLSEYKSVDTINYSQEREYYYTYSRQVNGIVFSGDAISISVNNYTGAVTNYNCSYSSNTKFESPDKVIGLEAAKKAFTEKLGLKLVYNFKTEKEKVVTYLAYVPKDSNKYIDAITGGVERIPNQYGIYYSNAMMEKTASSTDAAGQVVLTPDEIEAVKGISGLLSKEDLDKKIRGINQFNLDSEFTLENADLRKDWNSSDTLIWNLRYVKVLNKETNQTREVSVSVDARSGELLNFWTYYNSPEGTKPQKTKEEAKKISEDTLKEILPSYYSKVKYDDSYYTYDEAQNQQYTFRFVRVENGIEVPGDYLSISYDNLSSNVVSLYTNWTKDLKFDSADKVIKIEKAYEVLFDKIGYNIQYFGSINNQKVYEPTVKGPEEAVLGYVVNNNMPSIISAETGDILDYSGAVFKGNNASDYTDIKGLKAEEQIKILTQLSIRYYENELKANDQLLQKDYFILLSMLNDFYYFDINSDKDTAVEKMYTSLINSGIITKAEKAPTATLTREEAAKYFVKFLRLGHVAEIKGIYKSDFKDAAKINSNLLGYVCIASGLKAMNGSNGMFNPKSKMTRLEGLLAVYSYLSNK